jgi:hypothetical protein
MGACGSYLVFDCLAQVLAQPAGDVGLVAANSAALPLTSAPAFAGTDLHIRHTLVQVCREDEIAAVTRSDLR